MRKTSGACDKLWKGLWVDSVIPVDVLEGLNSVPNLSVIQTCGGHDPLTGWGRPNPWFRIRVASHGDVLSIHNAMGSFAVIEKMGRGRWPTVDISCPKSICYTSRYWVDRWWRRCVAALRMAIG